MISALYYTDKVFRSIFLLSVSLALFHSFVFHPVAINTNSAQRKKKYDYFPYL